ncbi:MAG: heme ABC exporter ATP-binding protein CcmA [Pseudomonadota bacterium]
MEPLVNASGLRCERDARALFSGLDLALEPGEILELRGPNGAGKSTLLRILAGLYPDYEGELSVAPFTYLGHKPGINPRLCVADNLIYLARLAGTADIEQIASTLERVGLAGFEPLGCDALSAGQLRRVALAGLLLRPRPLWLLDEPFTALDEAGIALVEALLGAHARGGGAAICATHQSLSSVPARTLTL